jgi:hypothetical protein
MRTPTHLSRAFGGLSRYRLALTAALAITLSIAEFISLAFAVGPRRDIRRMKKLLFRYLEATVKKLEAEARKTRAEAWKVEAESLSVAKNARIGGTTPVQT